MSAVKQRSKFSSSWIVRTCFSFLALSGQLYDRANKTRQENRREYIFCNLNLPFTPLLLFFISLGFPSETRSVCCLMSEGCYSSTYAYSRPRAATPNYSTSTWSFSTVFSSHSIRLYPFYIPQCERTAPFFHFILFFNSRRRPV